MRAAALVAPRRIELVDLPRPALGPHDVRLAPAAVGVCGTDLHIWSGESNFHMDERLLMEAFAQLCRQRPDVHLLLAGAPLEATTPEQHAATSGRVHHVGWQPFSRMKEFLGAADLFFVSDQARCADAQGN